MGGNKIIMVYIDEKRPPLKLTTSRDFEPLTIQVKNTLLTRLRIHCLRQVYLPVVGDPLPL